MKPESNRDARSCERFQTEIKAWLDGELPSLRMELLEAHLQACAPCRTLADHFRKLTTKLQEALDPVPARSAKSLAANAVHAARSMDREEALSVRSLQRVSMAAAALLCISLAFAFTSGRPNGEDTTTAYLSQAGGLDDVLDFATSDSAWGDDL